MTTLLNALSHLSDQELIAEVKVAAAGERQATARLIAVLVHDKLRRAQELLRHAVPSGDPAVIVDRALTLLLAQLEHTKCGLTAHPRASRPVSAGSRHIPASVKREVWKRDGGQCAFVGSEGRCSERGFLEYHHVIPYAGGGTGSTENIQLRCRVHNVYEAESLGLFAREHPSAYTIATRSRPTLSHCPRVGRYRVSRSHDSSTMPTKDWCAHRDPRIFVIIV